MCGIYSFIIHTDSPNICNLFPFVDFLSIFLKIYFPVETYKKLHNMILNKLCIKAFFSYSQTTEEILFKQQLIFTFTKELNRREIRRVTVKHIVTLAQRISPFFLLF